MGIEVEVNAIIDGNLREFESLVQRFQKPIFKFLLGMGIPQDQVEDLAQDVFLAVYRHLSSFDASKSQLSTWIFAIAKNKAINFVRLKKLKSFFGFHNEILESEKMENPIEVSLQSQDKRKLVREALENVSATQRSVVVLFYYNELSLEEIAIIENCSVGTVKSRLHRLKNELKTKLNREAL